MDILEFIVKSSLYLVFAFLVYKLLLRNNNDFGKNRSFIIISMIAALALPFISFNITNPVSEPANALNRYLLKPIDIYATGRNIKQYTTAGWNPIFITYLAGLTILTVIFIIKLISFSRIFKESKVERQKGYKLISSSKIPTPFSFFRFIFVHEDIQDKKLQTIIQHELVHVRKIHSADKLLSELFLIASWFNPLAWWFRKELGMVHEYQADQESIKKTGKNNYMKVLVNTTAGIPVFSLANNFNQSIIKRRLKMIVQNKHSKFGGAKTIAAFVLSLVVFAFIACSEKDTSDKNYTNQKATEKPVAKPGNQQATENKDVKNEPVYTVVEVMPGFPGGKDELIKYLSSNIQYPESAKKNGIQGTSFISFTVMKDGSIDDVALLRGFNEACDNEALRVVKEMPDWEPGKQDGKHVNTKFNIPIRFKLDNKEK